MKEAYNRSLRRPLELFGYSLLTKACFSQEQYLRDKKEVVAILHPPAK